MPAVNALIPGLFISGGKMKIKWMDRSKIFVNAYDNKDVTISANKEGLLSLANQLLVLAEGMPGDHIHYDEHNSLEEGSLELIIEKVK